MKYVCKVVGGKHVAVALDGDGAVVAVSPPCHSKFHAMRRRDLAHNENATMPSGWAPPTGDLASTVPVEPEPVTDVSVDVPAAFAAFDHDGDGKPGGSKPKRERKPKVKTNKPASKVK